MTVPVSVRLDDDVRATLEDEARTLGLPLSTLLRQLAAEAATRVRRERIHAQSAAVGRHVAASPEAQALVEDLGRPPVDGL